MLATSSLLSYVPEMDEQLGESSTAALGAVVPPFPPVCPPMHISVFSFHTLSCEYFSDVSFWMRIRSAPRALPGMNPHDRLQMAGSDLSGMWIIKGRKSHFQSLCCLNPGTSSIRHTRRDFQYTADTINIFLYLTAVGPTGNVLRCFCVSGAPGEAAKLLLLLLGW